MSSVSETTGRSEGQLHNALRLKRTVKQVQILHLDPAAQINLILELT